MPLLNSHNTTPPGGWVYRQVETDFTMKEENLAKLIKTVVAHRIYRNLKPDDAASVQLDVERQICVRLGRLECHKEGKTDKWVPQDELRDYVTMSGVLGFSKAAIAFVKSGGAMATPEVSAARAAICAVCPLNQPMTGCACNVFYKVLDATVPAARRIAGMHVCRACQCTLAVKILLTDEQVIISNEDRNITWPEQNCWQKTIMQRSASG
jgi:hypothetical protein